MPLFGAVPVMLSAGERTTLKKRVRGAKTAYRDLCRPETRSHRWPAVSAERMMR
jgi:hypothetical protein